MFKSVLTYLWFVFPQNLASLIQALTNETDDANLADVKLNARKNEENDDEDDDDEEDGFYENDLLD